MNFKKIKALSIFFGLIFLIIVMLCVPRIRLEVYLTLIELSPSSSIRPLCVDHLGELPQSCYPRLLDYAKSKFGGRNFHWAQKILNKQNRGDLQKELKSRFEYAELSDRLIYLWYWFSLDSTDQRVRELVDENIGLICDGSVIARREWIGLLNDRGLIEFRKYDHLNGGDVEVIKLQISGNVRFPSQKDKAPKAQ